MGHFVQNQLISSLPSRHGGPSGNGVPNAALIHDRGVIERHALATVRVPTQVCTCRYGHVSPSADTSGKRPHQLLGYGPADRADRLSQAPERRISRDRRDQRSSRCATRLEAYRFRRHLYYATCAILMSIPSSYSEGVRYPSPF